MKRIYNNSNIVNIIKTICCLTNNYIILNKIIMNKREQPRNVLVTQCDMLGVTRVVATHVVATRVVATHVGATHVDTAHVGAHDSD